MSGRKHSFGAAILAGGKASRYGGANKAALDGGDGRTIVGRLLDELAAAGLREVVLCANDPAPYRSLSLPVLGDRPADCGPLGGVAAALAHYAGRTDATVLLACDMPGVTAGAVRKLLDAFEAAGRRVVVAETGDSFWHPLCSVVHNDVLADVAAAIRRGELGVGRLWRALDAAAVHFEDEALLFNVNTPQDMAKWRERKRDCP